MSLTLKIGLKIFSLVIFLFSIAYISKIMTWDKILIAFGIIIFFMFLYHILAELIK